MNLGVHTQNKFIIHLFLRMLCLVLMLHFCAEHCEHALLWSFILMDIIIYNVIILNGIKFTKVSLHSCKSVNLLQCFYINSLVINSSPLQVGVSIVLSSYSCINSSPLQVGVSIVLSSSGLTKVVTFTPYYMHRPVQL